MPLDSVWPTRMRSSQMVWLVWFSAVAFVAGSKPVYNLDVILTGSASEYELVKQAADKAVADVAANSSFGFTITPRYVQLPCADGDSLQTGLESIRSTTSRTAVVSVCDDVCDQVVQTASMVHLAPVVSHCSKYLAFKEAYPNYTRTSPGSWQNTAMIWRSLPYSDMCWELGVDSLPFWTWFIPLDPTRPEDNIFVAKYRACSSVIRTEPAVSATWPETVFKIIRSMGYNETLVLSDPSSTTPTFDAKAMTTAFLVEMSNLPFWPPELAALMPFGTDGLTGMPIPGTGTTQSSLKEYYAWNHKTIAKYADFEPAFKGAIEKGARIVVFDMTEVACIAAALCEMHRINMFGDEWLPIFVQQYFSIQDVFDVEGTSHPDYGEICDAASMLEVVNGAIVISPSLGDNGIAEISTLMGQQLSTGGKIRSQEYPLAVQMAGVYDDIWFSALRMQDYIDRFGDGILSTGNTMTETENDDLIIGVHDIDFQGWSGHVKFIPTHYPSFWSMYSMGYERHGGLSVLKMIKSGSNIELKELGTDPGPDFCINYDQMLMHGYPKGLQNYSKWSNGPECEEQWSQVPVLWGGTVGKIEGAAAKKDSGDPIVWKAGAQAELPVGHAARCDIGHQQKYPLDSENNCAKCSPGKYNHVYDSECKFCPMGSYSGEGVVVCPLCQAGDFGNATGMSECHRCAPGSDSPAGSTECHECFEGAHRNDDSPGNACLLCAEGRYASTRGATECTACPPRWMTQVRGSMDKLDCSCAPGTYLPCLCPDGNCGSNMTRCAVVEGNFKELETMSCKVCPEGFECPGWTTEVGGVPHHAQPILQQGFYISKKNLYNPLICTTADEFCLGGQVPAAAGKCGGGRKGFQCYACEGGYFADPGEKCTECSFAYLYMPGAWAVCLMGLLWINRIANATTKAGTALAKTALMSSFNMVIDFGARLGLMATFQVEWPPEFKKVLSMFTFFVFDTAFLSPACYFGYGGLLSLYLPSLLSPIIIVLSFFFLWCASHVLHTVINTKVLDGNGCMNATGVLMSALFIGVAKSVLNVFECRDQPSGQDTLKMYDGFECTIEDLTPVIPLAVLFSFLYIISMFALYAYVLILAPSRFWSQESFRKRFRFLLGRWNPAFWYWGGILLLRSLAMAACGVVTKDPQTQLILAILINAGPCIGSAACRPWKEKAGNQLDCTMSSSIIILCLLGLCIKTDKEPGEEAMEPSSAATLSDVKVVIVVFGLIAGIIFAGVAYWKRAETNENELSQKALNMLQELNETHDQDRKIAEADMKGLLVQMTYTDLGRMSNTIDVINSALSCNIPHSLLSGIKPLPSQSAKRLAPCVEGCLPTDPPAMLVQAKS